MTSRSSKSGRKRASERTARRLFTSPESFHLDFHMPIIHMAMIVRPLAVGSVLQARNALCTNFNRSFATSTFLQSSDSPKIDVRELLSKPTWSVASLLPSQTTTQETPEITSKQLHHLLRLSALPPPKDAQEEAKMLSTLSSQLHFVKDIQKVDTTGIEPLKSLRDETVQGEKEAEIGLETLKEALGKEEIRGKYHKRIRRRRDGKVERMDAEWDVLGTASRRVGRYFVVEGGKDR